MWLFKTFPKNTIYKLQYDKDIIKWKTKNLTKKVL